jgi:hypothetical protein
MRCTSLMVSLSIVLVHGLQGHPRNTWTWEPDANHPANSTAIKGKLSRVVKRFWSRKVNPDHDSSNAAEGTERTSVFWPYHLLPQDCPSSRILTWGYDSVVSKFFNDSANKNNIFMHSRDLLEDLSWERRLCVS